MFWWFRFEGGFLIFIRRLFWNQILMFKMEGKRRIFGIKELVLIKVENQGFVILCWLRMVEVWNLIWKKWVEELPNTRFGLRIEGITFKGFWHRFEGSGWKKRSVLINSYEAKDLYRCIVSTLRIHTKWWSKLICFELGPWSFTKVQQMV